MTTRRRRMMLMDRQVQPKFTLVELLWWQLGNERKMGRKYNALLSNFLSCVTRCKRCRKTVYGGGKICGNCYSPFLDGAAAK